MLYHKFFYPYIKLLNIHPLIINDHLIKIFTIMKPLYQIIFNYLLIKQINKNILLILFYLLKIALLIYIFIFL